MISSLAITGDASFTVNAPFSTPFILPVGKSIVVSVTVNPLSVGVHTAILTITHSGQGTPANINLSSEGVGEGETGGDAIHSSKLALVDGYGHIRGYYDANEDSEMRSLLKDSKRLIKQTF